MISCPGGDTLYERAKRLATVLEAKAKSADPRLVVVIVPGTNTLVFGMLMFTLSKWRRIETRRADHGADIRSCFRRYPRSQFVKHDRLGEKGFTHLVHPTLLREVRPNHELHLHLRHFRRLGAVT